MPSLTVTDVQDTFAAKDGEAFVNSVFISSVKKHDLEEKVSLGLLQRHFDLEDGEKGGVPISPRFHGRLTFKSIDLTDLSIQRLSEGICSRCHDCEPRWLCLASPVNMSLAKRLRVQLLPRGGKCASQAQ
jgi:hypothetical protein